MSFRFFSKPAPKNDQEQPTESNPPARNVPVEFPVCALTQFDKTHSLRCKLIAIPPPPLNSREWKRITETDERFAKFSKHLKKSLKFIDVCPEGLLYFSRKCAKNGELFTPYDPQQTIDSFIHMVHSEGSAKGIGVRLNSSRSNSIWGFLDTLDETNTSFIKNTVYQSVHRINGMHLLPISKSGFNLDETREKLSSSNVAVDVFRKHFAKFIWDSRVDPRINSWAITLFYPIFVENPDTFHVPDFMLWENPTEGKDIPISSFGTLASVLSNNFLLLSSAEYQGVKIDGGDEAGEAGANLVDLLNHITGTDLTHLFFLLMFHGLMKTTSSNETDVALNLLEYIGICMWKIDTCPGFLPGFLAAAVNWEGESPEYKLPSLIIHWMNNAPTNDCYKTCVRIMAMIVKSGSIVPKFLDAQIPNLIESEEWRVAFQENITKRGNDILSIRLVVDILSSLTPTHSTLAFWLFQISLRELETMAESDLWIDPRILISLLASLLNSFMGFVNPMKKILIRDNLTTRITEFIAIVKKRSKPLPDEHDIISNSGLAKTKLKFDFNEKVQDLLSVPPGGHRILENPLPTILSIREGGDDVRFVSDNQIFAHSAAYSRNTDIRDTENLDDLIRLAEETMNSSLSTMHRTINGWGIAGL
ncbi:hypothetical protein HK098_002042 [Nowakowskiella sp. JEL0407]|nr:hypothetical protein HK098_002042 [Nowakowskiella sp. JEL0407]